MPQALQVLFSFQTEAIQPFITYDNYFGFVLQVVLALGLSFELPLVIIILAWLGVIGAAELARFRRFAVVGAFAAGAILSPGTDLVSMVMMTLPLLLLYEVGYAGAVRDPAPAAKAAAIAAMVLLALGLGGGPGRGAGSRPGRAGRRSGPTRSRTRRARSPARRSTAPPPAGSASRPRPPEASRPTTPCSRP